VPAGIESFAAGDPATAYANFDQAAAIGDRFRDPDLVTPARTGQGRALIRLGQIAEGMALLDEVMVAVTADEVSPIAVGSTYCSVIDACQEIFDLRRARPAPPRRRLPNCGQCCRTARPRRPTRSLP
jgi:hypothetical protein